MTEAEKLGREKHAIAYFSMEIGLENDLPTYSGGLGMLAGDTIRSAADLQVPMVAVSLLYRKGYFSQRIDDKGWQQEEPVKWQVEKFLKSCEGQASVSIEGREVKLRAWRYDVIGHSGYLVPVYFLDAHMEGNAPEDREFTGSLYGGDQRYRLCQEAILGIGGVRMLRAMGYQETQRFHMNEGHASLLALELLHEEVEKAGADPEKVVERVRQRCVFTTHTPVPAGHDQFEVALVRRVLGENALFERYSKELMANGSLNMTLLALNLSGYVNGVAKRHGEVSRSMFPDYLIDSITNGVHCVTWATEPFRRLFDRFIPGWQDDNFSLRQVLKIPRPEVTEAHNHSKQALFEEIQKRTGVNLRMDFLTIGFARRAATYKRADLIFDSITRLKEIAMDFGPLQLVFAGKAHPRDEGGKVLIQRIIRAREELKGSIELVYLPNYDMALGRLVCGGVDLWLNNPQPPLEASGTSGMKAALNGVPSLSVLDGWWVEGHIEDVTGWAIETSEEQDPIKRRAHDAQKLYDKLKQVTKIYYRHPRQFMDVMSNAIALNGSFFNTQRMVQQYVLRAYFP